MVSRFEDEVKPRPRLLRRSCPWQSMYGDRSCPTSTSSPASTSMPCGVRGHRPSDPARLDGPRGVPPALDRERDDRSAGSGVPGRGGRRPTGRLRHRRTVPATGGRRTGGDDGARGAVRHLRRPADAGTRRGTAVHDAVLRVLAAQSNDEAALWVLVDSAASRRWYERRGWRADGALSTWSTGSCRSCGCDGALPQRLPGWRADLGEWDLTGFSPRLGG
jgi:hypothetical protein